MKKKYQTPETELFRVTFEQNILSNGENVSVDTSYIDDEDFWS